MAVVSLGSAGVVVADPIVDCDDSLAAACQAVSVPEPSSLPLMAIGLAALCVTMVVSHYKRAKI